MKYTMDEFLIPARDTNGHSNRTYFRISPTMERAVSVVLQNKELPYRTASDLMRHAVYRHLGWLHKIEPDMPTHFQASLEAILEIVREDEHRSSMEGVFDTLGRRLEFHLDRGDMGEAYRLAALIRGQIRRIADCAWKERYLIRFNRQFRGISVGGSGGSGSVVRVQRALLPGVDDDDSNEQ